MQTHLDVTELPEKRLELGRVAVVVAEEAAEPLAAADLALRATDLLPGSDDLAAQALVIPLTVIVGEEIGDYTPKLALAEKDEMLERLGLKGAAESLHVRVQIGALAGKANHLDAAGLEQPPEGAGVEAIPVQDQVVRCAVRYPSVGIGDSASEMARYHGG